MNGLTRIGVFAHNTFREAVRDRLLYNLLLFAGLMIASSVVLAKLHMGYEERIYRDVGLAAIGIFGALIAIFVGVNLVYREISLHTVYAMLAKPVHRYEFLLGKYFGLLAVIALEVVIMTTFFLVVLWIKGSPSTLSLAWAIGLIFLELALLTAIAIFFSTFTTPYLAGMFTLALWIIGHLLGDIRAFGAQDGAELYRPITEFLYWVLPNLDRLDIKAAAADGKVIELATVAYASLYAVLYSALLLLAGTLLFERRDFR